MTTLQAKNAILETVGLTDHEADFLLHCVEQWAAADMDRLNFTDNRGRTILTTDGIDKLADRLQKATQLRNQQRKTSLQPRRSSR